MKLKKTLLMSTLFLCTFSPISLFAQKGNKTIKATKLQPAKPELKNLNDSISYTFANGMTQGLVQYLIQGGLMTDTSAINAEYKIRIDVEKDKKTISKLQKEYKNKLDSATTANNLALATFINGFHEAFIASPTQAAYFSGVALGSQTMSATQKFAQELLANETDFNKDVFLYAFVNGMNGNTPATEIASAHTDMNNLIGRAQKLKEAAKEKEKEQQAIELKKKYEAKLKANQKFLNENKARPGVVELESGLQYEILTKRTGAKPRANDIVTVHYVGTLLDGTKFDSSYDRGEPMTFAVGQVIKGWTEALQLMPAGSKWKLYIPHDLAYGDRDTGVIEPFSTLIFEVELLNFKTTEQLQQEMDEEY